MQNNQKEIILLKDLGYIYPTEKSKHKVKYGIYKCFCGKEFKTQINYIKSNHTKSCGCLKKQILKERNLVHGFRYHRLYGTWKMMISRCNNQNNIGYKYYGGRGIKVCNRWLQLENFIEDMYPTFKEGLTLDRKNIDGNYEPSNCRWVTKNTQSRNTKKIHKYNTTGFRGVCWNKSSNKFVARICVKYKQIHLGCFNTDIEAAKAYDQYVIDNNLEHTTNGVL